MTRGVHELRVHLHLVLIDHVDASVLELGRSAVRHINITIIVTEGDQNSHLAVWLRRQIERCQLHFGIGVPDVGVRHLHHMLLRHPAELVQIPQSVVQSSDIGIVAHPIKRVAVGQTVGSSVEQPEVVSQLVNCNHHFEIVADRFTSVAHGSLLTNPGHTLRAHRGLLRGDGVHKIVVVKAVLGPVLGVANQRLAGAVVETGEWPAVRLVPLTVAGVVHYLRDNGNIQVVLAIGHSLECLAHAGENLLLIMLDGVVVLLRRRGQTAVASLPVHDNNQQLLHALCPRGAGLLLGLLNKRLHGWVDMPRGRPHFRQLIGVP
mmetsp:Transcript_1378/g.2779  ORF Transcript_1378/g.2779 Transcript_1378/m.2779 type:complete len:319 (-) Transcript_1378:128-1084(-)